MSGRTDLHLSPYGSSFVHVLLASSRLELRGVVLRRLLSILLQSGSIRALSCSEVWVCPHTYGWLSLQGLLAKVSCLHTISSE